MNYAEDKDNDMDYEYTSTPSAASSSSKSGAGVAVEVAVAPTTASSRRASAVGGTGSKDKEGATAMVATVTSAGSKKRKNHHIAPVMPRDLGLSNMLSFENPYMRDGKLIACDGTTLSVNGTSSMFLNLVSSKSFTNCLAPNPSNIYGVLQTISTSFANLPASPIISLASWSFYTLTTTRTSPSTLSESTGITGQKIFKEK